MPKPLLPVADAPFLDLLLFEVARHGIRRILLLAGFASEQIAAYAAATPLKDRFGLDIEVVVDRLSMSQPAVSKHLRVLREAGVVSARVDAQRRLLPVESTSVFRLRRNRGLPVCGEVL